MRKSSLSSPSSVPGNEVNCGYTHIISTIGLGTLNKLLHNQLAMHACSSLTFACTRIGFHSSASSTA